MPDLLAGFEDFCQRLRVPTKDAGLKPLWPLYETQDYLLAETRAALEAGVHTLVILKGRQLGATTLIDTLTLYWLQAYAGMIGMLVSDDPDNMKYRRLVLRGMLATLPRASRYPVNVDNLGQLVWMEPRTREPWSMLLFAAAGKREDSNMNLGRSKGLNYLEADEVGAWQNERAVGALEASLSDNHPQRLYSFNSTGQGHGIFKTIWDTAQRAVTQRAIFIGGWRHHLYRIARGTPLWKEYAGAPTTEERAALRTIRKRYAYDVAIEHVVWRRYQLAEKFRGDEVMLAQEHPWLPEDAFQAFGDKFIPLGVVRKLYAALPSAQPEGFRYEFGKYFDTTKPMPCAPTDAPLKVYEEPSQYAVYIVSAHPWGSSSDDATAAEIQVWRAWPDVLELVAEYHTEDPDMYQFAWVCLHMMAAYRSFANSHSYNPVFFILEIGWGGERVLREIDNIRSRGYGLSSEVVGREQFLNMTGCIEYFFRRIDTFASTTARQSKTTGEERARKLFALRDELTREHLVIPSPALVDELSMLRLGEEGKADEIGGGAESPEARAITAAMAVICRLDQDVDTAVRTHIAPKQAVERETHVGEVLVGNALGRLIRTGRI